MLLIWASKCCWVSNDSSTRPLTSWHLYDSSSWVMKSADSWYSSFSCSETEGPVHWCQQQKHTTPSVCVHDTEQVCICKSGSVFGVTRHKRGFNCRRGPMKWRVCVHSHWLYARSHTVTNLSGFSPACLNFTLQRRGLPPVICSLKMTN